MFWVNDLTGGLVNLARAKRLYKEPGITGNSITIRAVFDDHVYDIYRSDLADAAKTFDQLRERLLNRQQNEYIVE